jgi:MFS family permease
LKIDSMLSSSPLDRWVLRNSPLWYRTPTSQTVALGLVFFFVFTSYTTIQFYARTTYGERLAANSVAAVYVAFTIGCGTIAPSFTNKFGPRRTMLFGIVGYAALVAASLCYFINDDEDGLEWLVVCGGVVLGFGASLLWTAQGRLVLDYAAVESSSSQPQHLGSTTTEVLDEPRTGTLMGIFWAVFQCSSLVGGAISFGYYNKDTPTGSVSLYLIFLVFILLGAMATQLLLPPSMLGTKVVANNNDNNNNKNGVPSEETRLLEEALQIEDVSHAKPFTSSSSWRSQVRETFQVFRTKPMLMLSPLFFYTGFNQPYQQSTFGNRFFTKRTIGIELIIFHLTEIVGGLYCGRALDDYTSSSSLADRRRRPAISCLCLFIFVNSLGNLLALHQERTVVEDANTDANALDIISDWPASLPPSLAFACWGFADAQIQVYCYWIIGTLFQSGEDHSRAVGFYKCAQSLGVAIGVYLTPLSRLSALRQWTLSTIAYVVGIALAFWQLPVAGG